MSTSFIPPSEFEEYRTVRPLGRGGMGCVFLAHDTLLDRQVAVKFIATASPDARSRQQFFIEARALARLSHPNVVAVHRVGEVRRQPFLVSEFVRGSTLAELEWPLPPARLLGIAIGLARGLAAAHRCGVLHRDIKPANVVITEDGEAKLIDFGLARLFVPEGGAAAPAADGGRARLVGTPRYIAPELWRGEPPTPAADVYGFGVMLFELLLGRALPEHPDTDLAELPELSHLAAPLAAVARTCLAREPTRRYATAEGLRDALERLAAAMSEGGPELIAANPYPGLSSFDAGQSALFFGRRVEVRAIVDRLRTEPFVLVAGDSGVGKSSLCRAGVIPALGSGWRVASLVPGRRPVLALAAAIAHALGREEQAVEAELRARPTELAAALARAGPLLVFVDQLEELVTMAEAAEAELFAEAWAALAVARPGLRLLGTIRGDLLTRLGGLRPLRGLVGPSLYVLAPLAPAGVRSAIVDPAARGGARFETPALVDELVGSVERGPGGLPLLQFALAALWERRDQARGVIQASALEALGGVDGALAHHADGVVTRLRPTERSAARSLLTRLVTSDGTRARYRQDELVGGDGGEARAALEALVRGRLLVVREADDGGGGTYELAHEALITRWQTLRGWLAENVEARAAEERLAGAAREWARLGRPGELLLSGRQLQELDRIHGVSLTSAAAAFVGASRKHRQRRRRRVWAVGGAATLAVALAMLAISASARRAQDAAVASRVEQASTALATATRRSAELASASEQAFFHFDHRDDARGEPLWQKALGLAHSRDAAWARAGAALEGALALAPGRADLRANMADLLLDRVRAAGLHGRDREELLVRLAAHDQGGTRLARLSRPARLVVHSRPDGARATLSRFSWVEGRLRREPARELPGRSGLTAVEPGSYLLELALPGRAVTRLPLLVHPGESAELSIDLPAARDVPPGYVHVPAGRFLYGSDDETLRRSFLNAQPLHETETAAYLIARHEVTFADYMAFLDDLPAGERERRRPLATNRSHRLELDRRRGQWVFELATSAHRYRARVGEPVRYRERDRRVVQDWRRFPVGGVSFHDGLAFASWLDRTGRLPGARMCTEHEWERAARGADGRRFPFGDRARPDDFNHDVTYGVRLRALGPDEVGSHPDSVSPVGLDDMAGNIFEWVRGAAGLTATNRGGSWRQGEIVSRADNRELTDPTLRLPDLGLRICASASPVWALR